MTVYKVKFYTLSRGKNPNGEAGNLRQSTEIAYIQCRDTSRIEAMLDKYYETPVQNGSYYLPVIENIEAISGFCIIEDK